MTITRLLALFFCGTFAYVIAVTNFTEFIKYEDLGGFTCPSDQVVFDDEDKGSLVQCVLKCSKTSTCYGVFHVEENMRCVGCKDEFLTNATAPLLDGTKHYSRRRNTTKAYRLVKQNFNWTDAKKHCEDLGGYIADIKTQEEQRYLEKYVFPADKRVWLGAKSDAHGVYLWQDGSNVSDGYNNWYPGRPDGVGCAVFSPYLVYWYDLDCDMLFFSLCEFD